METSDKGEIVIYHPDEITRLEVQVKDETVWLNRHQLSSLFGRDIKTIGKHINNALTEELSELTVVANFATTASDGKRYIIEYYNQTSLPPKQGIFYDGQIFTATLSKQLQLDIKRHNVQYPIIDVHSFTKAHDRFLIIDEEVYLIGASIKDLGKKWFGFTLMENTDAEGIINKQYYGN